MQIIPGKIQTLPVYDSNHHGYMLGDEHNFVILPKRDVTKQLEDGEEVEVFTFYNEDQELEATTVLPMMQVGEMACLKASNTNSMGAFVKIGTTRDILIPTREQREPIEAGQMVLMILREDHEYRRLFGSTRISSNLLNKDMTYERGDEVELMIAEKIDVGRRVVVNGKHFAALFDQEIMQKLHFGEKVKGYVRQIEGKDLVVSMQREGLDLLEDAKSSIMNFLLNNNGYARLNDDTDPEEIKLRLRMSKKTFKKAAGMLFKEGKVILTKLGIKINKDGEIPTEWKNTKLVSDDEPKQVRKTVAEDLEERPAVKPRKEFVDKRQYKGRVNEFDNRNSSIPRDKTPERSERRPADDREPYTPRTPRTSGTDSRPPARKYDSPKRDEAPREPREKPSGEPKRVLKRRDEPGGEKK